MKKTNEKDENPALAFEGRNAKLTQQCNELRKLMEYVNPWLDRVTLKSLGGITFAGEHGFGGRHGLDLYAFFRWQDLPSGTSLKTQGLIGMFVRGEIKDEQTPTDVQKYRQINWFYTRNKRWLEVIIDYEIHHKHGGSGVHNFSLQVSDVTLEYLLGKYDVQVLMRGLSEQTQRIIDRRFNEVQELIALQARVGLMSDYFEENYSKKRCTYFHPGTPKGQEYAIMLEKSKEAIASKGYQLVTIFSSNLKPAELHLEDVVYPFRGDEIIQFIKACEADALAV